MTSEKRLNIVHVTQFLEIGGLESFIVELSRKTDKTAFNVNVLCLNGCNEKYRESLEQSGIGVHLIKKEGKYDASFFSRTAAFLKHNKTDVLHSHGGCFLYSTIMGKLADVGKIIYTVHGLPVEYGLKARIEEVLACCLADNIVAVSEEIADKIKLRTKLFDNKIEVVINGIDHQKYRPCEDADKIIESKIFYGLPLKKKIVGSVGRLESVKNYSLLLRAFSELVHAYKNDSQLVLVGAGSEETTLKALAKDLSISENISFLGMQNDLPSIYPLLDVFVLSSLTEGTSMSLLEAQSCGIPAVVTDVGGNSNIIANGVNGILCKSGDQTAMAAHLDRLLNNDSARMKMKREAREVIERRFDMVAMVQQYQRIYRDSSVPKKILVPGRA